MSRSLTVSVLATLITSSFKFRSLVYGVEDKVKQQKVNYGKYPSDSEWEVVLWWFWHQSLKTLCFQFITLCIFIIFICKKSVPANVISYAVLVLLRIIQNVNMHDSLEITNTVFIWEGCFYQESRDTCLKVISGFSAYTINYSQVCLPYIDFGPLKDTLWVCTHVPLCSLLFLFRREEKNGNSILCK